MVREASYERTDGVEPAGDGWFYPASDLAQRYRAGVDKETSEPTEAHEGFADERSIPDREGWLPR